MVTHYSHHISPTIRALQAAAVVFPFHKLVAYYLCLVLFSQALTIGLLTDKLKSL